MNGTEIHARRYAKACDACYKKKIKCVYREPTCELCVKTGQECKFTRMEKSLPKKPRRGKYLAALEERMMKMESLLQQSNEEQRNGNRSPEDDDDSIPSTETLETLSSMFNNSRHIPSREEILNAPKFRFPSKEEATQLAMGYFASCNHLMPIFSKDTFMRRMEIQYPPSKDKDYAWWSTVVTVLCYAHRLRAMSTPDQANTENNRACPYMKQLLDMAPKLSYGPASMETAQVLLGIAGILRGSAMPDLAPMLVSVAVRMLQTLDAHKADLPGGRYYASRNERERTFWVAYILDKDIALLTRKPPVIAEMDIGRPPPLERCEDRVGTVRSLDSRSDVNLFRASQKLASIQAKVWERTLSGSASMTRQALQLAQSELNPALAAWKAELPFKFRKEDLVGRWPKHAIIHIVVMHFRYFHTLVELNKEPPMDKDDMNPLNDDCPVAQSLPSYPHSTALVAVEAARDALDLASLTPRGNFQNVWLYFEFSICAVLTLLVNGIVRPFGEHISEDLRRVETWLKVIDILATSSERHDLLAKKEFLMHMRAWTMKEVQGQPFGNGSDCMKAAREYLESEAVLQATELEGLDLTAEGWHPDMFPLDQIHEGNLLRDSWMDDGMTWPYFARYPQA